VLINQSYRGQRVTGQQRYAAEIARRLGPETSFRPQGPRGFWAASTARVWAWVQFVLPVIARGSVVLSMTARAPLWCRRQVLVVHDLFVLDHPEWFSRTYVWTHAPLLRAQIKSAAAVVAVSQPVADELSALRRDDVVVAPNAPSEVFRGGGPEPSNVLSVQGLEPGSYFLAVGSRDPRKNLHGLAEAYALLDDEERRDHPLVLVGGGAGIYRNQNIHWPEGTVDAGYVDDEELRRLYRDARAVVFVSLAEGFGLPLVEAAAAGASSLLISDIEVFRWICADQARYVDPTWPNDIARGLRAEIDAPSSQDIDLDRFSWDTSAAAVESVCLRVAGGR
jgi:glycosyltransferase involved in cell wall biosynthesis